MRVCGGERFACGLSDVHTHIDIYVYIYIVYSNAFFCPKSILKQQNRKKIDFLLIAARWLACCLRQQHAILSVAFVKCHHYIVARAVCANVQRASQNTRNCFRCYWLIKYVSFFLLRFMCVGVVSRWPLLSTIRVQRPPSLSISQSFTVFLCAAHKLELVLIGTRYRVN